MNEWTLSTWEVMILNATDPSVILYVLTLALIGWMYFDWKELWKTEQETIVTIAEKDRELAREIHQSKEKLFMEMQENQKQLQMMEYKMQQEQMKWEKRPMRSAGKSMASSTYSMMASGCKKAKDSVRYYMNWGSGENKTVK